MAQDTILGTDSGADAFLTKVNNDLAECFVNIEEVVAARTSTQTSETHASLDARLESIEESVAAASAGDGSLVSANDTTPGYLNGKLVAGEGIDLTENNNGGDETLTVSGENASVSNKGIASFNPADFTAANGVVSVAAGNIDSLIFFNGIAF